MGVTFDVLEFPADPPAESELVNHLWAQVGDVTGIESYRIKGRRAELSCMYDTYTHPYALAFLLARGGTPVDRRTGAPAAVTLPDYVRTPWRELSWWRRLRIRVAYYRAPFGRPPAPPR